MTRGGQPGARNHQWKGGRTVASSGYVLIRIPGHPMADSRGYVYEHRLVASEHLGRPLRRGEVVHHVNGDKLDNRWANLEVFSRAAHNSLHGHRTDLRRLGEPNATVSCECGCGATFDLFDGAGRPRRYLSGHNPRGVGSRFTT